MDSASDATPQRTHRLDALVPDFRRSHLGAGRGQQQAFDEIAAPAMEGERNQAANRNPANRRAPDARQIHQRRQVRRVIVGSSRRRTEIGEPVAAQVIAEAADAGAPKTARDFVEYAEVGRRADGCRRRLARRRSDRPRRGTWRRRASETAWSAPCRICDRAALDPGCAKYAKPLSPPQPDRKMVYYRRRIGAERGRRSEMADAAVVCANPCGRPRGTVRSSFSR